MAGTLTSGIKKRNLLFSIIFISFCAFSISLLYIFNQNDNTLHCCNETFINRENISNGMSLIIENMKSVNTLKPDTAVSEKLVQIIKLPSTSHSKRTKAEISTNNTNFTNLHTIETTIRHLNIKTEIEQTTLTNLLTSFTTLVPNITTELVRDTLESTVTGKKLSAILKLNTTQSQLVRVTDNETSSVTNTVKPKNVKVEHNIKNLTSDKIISKENSNDKLIDRSNNKEIAEINNESDKELDYRNDEGMEYSR